MQSAGCLEASPHTVDFGMGFFEMECGLIVVQIFCIPEHHFTVFDMYGGFASGLDSISHVSLRINMKHKFEAERVAPDGWWSDFPQKA